MSGQTESPHTDRDRPDFEFPAMTEDQVRILAKQLAKESRGGEVFLLEGPLGAGKTFFTRSFAEGLGVTSGVSSPTYVLHCEHQAPGGLVLHHLDFYRLGGKDESEDLGVEELCHPGAVVVAEWPDRCPGAFDSFTARLRFGILDDTHRGLKGWWGGLPFERSCVQELR